MYRFPRPPEQERWVTSLPNTLSSKLFDKNGIISRDIGVCTKHWPPDCVKRPVQGGSLRPVEPPSIFGTTDPLYFAQSIVSPDRCTEKRTVTAESRAKVSESRDKIACWNELATLLTGMHDGSN